MNRLKTKIITLFLFLKFVEKDMTFDQCHFLTGNCYNQAEGFMNRIKKWLTDYQLNNQPMELKQAVQTLKDHNEWRRDNKSVIPIPRTTRSKELGIAIDVVVNHLSD